MKLIVFKDIVALEINVLRKLQRIQNKSCNSSLGLFSCNRCVFGKIICRNVFVLNSKKIFKSSIKF